MITNKLKLVWTIYQKISRRSKKESKLKEVSDSSDNEEKFILIMHMLSQEERKC
jgi:hypothetical protein